LFAGVGAGLHFAADLPLPEAATGAAVTTASHLVCSWWLSPDLDIDSAIDDRWGPLGIVWAPYRWLIPHRSWLSHSGVSALLRLLYLVLIASAVLVLVDLVVPGALAQGRTWGLWVVAWAQSEPMLVAQLLGGAVFADLLHVAADLVLTHSKATMKKILPRFLYRAIVR
jgi:uncharacterized metal-binding protein